MVKNKDKDISFQKERLSKDRIVNISLTSIGPVENIAPITRVEAV